MSRFCCVFKCSNRSDRDRHLSLFKIPSVITHQGVLTEEISKKRRDQWIANIRRDAVKNGDIKYPHVCSCHFHEGSSRSEPFQKAITVHSGEYLAFDAQRSFGRKKKCLRRRLGITETLTKNGKQNTVISIILKH